MSGIYISGMQMPTSCGQCRFFAWSRGIGQHCAVASDITFHATIDGMDVNYERNGDCPLVSAADVRHVVLCKDCRHRDPEDRKCDCGQLERAGCVFPVDDDYFCAYGER